MTVLDHENGTEAADRVGTINHDGSRDYGCMMVNNKAHPDFFAGHNWQDAAANVAYAYSIYRSRGNFSAWYAVCTPDKQAKYSGIWCK